jgi:hypothetical protein
VTQSLLFSAAEACGSASEASQLKGNFWCAFIRSMVLCASLTLVPLGTCDNVTSGATSLERELRFERVLLDLRLGARS